MRPLPFAAPALPEAWAQVLDEVDATLREAEIVAAEREQAMSQLVSSRSAEKERDTSWQRAFEQLEKRMAEWPTMPRQAEGSALEPDLVLKVCEEAFRLWLSEAKALRQRLAKGIPPGV